MKRAVAVVVVGLAIAVLAASSCSIQHRSDDYACTSNADCSDGRFCDNGFCVVAGSLDAPRGDAGRGDANNCPAPCTTCNLQQKTCTINCQVANCNNMVMCPAGFRCDIMCNTDNACHNGISCAQATACNIQCTGKQSCENVVCGSGPCNVGCIGPESCSNVFCSNSCACDVVCTGSQSCADGIVCSSLACESGSGCSSAPALCHSCMN